MHLKNFKTTIMSSRISTYRTMTDAELYALLKDSDKIAFDQIYIRYWKKLFDDSFKRIRSAEVIEEIVQDVFADLWVKREAKEILNLYPYLLTCVRYKIFALYRKGKTAPAFEEAAEGIALSSLQADSLLHEKELKGCIALWLGLQPAKRGEIFRLRYIEELSTREISIMLNITQKTVQNQLITANGNLKKFLEKMMVILLSLICF